MIKRLLPLFLLLITICAIVPFTTAEAISYDIDFKIQTEAVELVNLDTDSVVFSQNASKKMYPASTTKIMTYIIVAEAVEDLNGTKITVKKEVLDALLGTGSSMAGVLEGEELTVMQLLNLMMVPSGNDAAAILADYVGERYGADSANQLLEAVIPASESEIQSETQSDTESKTESETDGTAAVSDSASLSNEEKFVAMMNRKAQELGCTGTHFVNSHGLQDPDHYTTAHDMALITKYAMTLPYFMDICNQTSYTLPPTNKSETERTVITTNKLLTSYDPTYYYQYAKGIKTGTTDKAGYCVVSTAVYNSSSYLCVALGAPSVNKKGEAIETRRDMIDTANLYRWAFTKMTLQPIAEQGSPVSEITLKYVWGKNSVLLSPEENFSAVLPVDVNPADLDVTMDLPESVSAPLQAGDIIGTATYSYNGQEVGTINVIVTEDLARNEFLVVTDAIFAVISSPIFIICAVLFVILLIVYICLAVRYNKKKKARMRHMQNKKAPRK